MYFVNRGMSPANMNRLQEKPNMKLHMQLNYINYLNKRKFRFIKSVNESLFYMFMKSEENKLLSYHSVVGNVYLAVVTPVQIMWIENLVNAEGSLQDIHEAFPEVTTKEVADIVYDGVKNDKIFTDIGNKFLGDLLYELPKPEALSTPTQEVLSSIKSVPEAMRDLPQVHHNPNVGHYPEGSPESSWTDSIIPIIVVGGVIITVGVIVYYFWKKRRGTGPGDSFNTRETTSKNMRTSSEKSEKSNTNRMSMYIRLQVEIGRNWTLVLILLWITNIFLVNGISVVYAEGWETLGTSESPDPEPSVRRLMQEAFEADVKKQLADRNKSVRGEQNSYDYEARAYLKEFSEFVNRSKPAQKPRLSDSYFLAWKGMEPHPDGIFNDDDINKYYALHWYPPAYFDPNKVGKFNATTMRMEWISIEAAEVDLAITAAQVLYANEEAIESTLQEVPQPLSQEYIYSINHAEHDKILSENQDIIVNYIDVTYKKIAIELSTVYPFVLDDTIPVTHIPDNDIRNVTAFAINLTDKNLPQWIYKGDDDVGNIAFIGNIYIDVLIEGAKIAETPLEKKILLHIMTYIATVNEVRANGGNEMNDDFSDFYNKMYSSYETFLNQLK
jgi:hypothetical protein